MRNHFYSNQQFETVLLKNGLNLGTAHWVAYVVHTPQKINCILYYPNLYINHDVYILEMKGAKI